jgi:hypothetical protein
MAPKIFKVVIVAIFLSLEAYAFSAVRSMDSDAVMWIALFSLSAIGIFALYVSSGQVNAISEKYNTIQQDSHDVKLKHDVVLNVLNDRLKNSTIGIQRHRELMEELAVSNPDLQILQKEAKKIKRDESILQEAIKDLEHFKSIQNSSLGFERGSIETDKLLSRIDRATMPYLMVKNNQLDYDIDISAPQSISGDIKKIEKILSAVIMEATNEMYSGRIEVVVSQSEKNGRILFDILPETMPDMSAFGDIVDDDELDGSQYSIRMLKNYIASELLSLMGGEMTIRDYRDSRSVSLSLPNNL